MILAHIQQKPTNSLSDYKTFYGFDKPGVKLYRSE